MTCIADLRAERTLRAPAVDVAEAAPPRLEDLAEAEKAELRRRM